MKITRLPPALPLEDHVRLLGRYKGGAGSLWSQTRTYGDLNKRCLMDWRGWTRSAIKRFLGEPDRKLKRRSGRVVAHPDRPECKYSMIRVLEAEESAAFREWWRRIEERRARADERRLGIEHEHTKRKGKAADGWEDGVPWELHGAFSALSRRDQRAVKLLYSRGMTQAQVGKKLGICQQTVGRIRQRFENKIKQHCPKMFFF